jgi:nanoRNase/pAp phosphatase (c-di-AMP/oligoRNAs hydrolase)
MRYKTAENVFDLDTKPRAVNSMVISAAIDLRQCVMATAAQMYSAKAAKSVQCVIVTDLLRFLSVNASGCTQTLFACMRCMKCDRVLVNSARQSHPRTAHCLSSPEQECNY